MSDGFLYSGVQYSPEEDYNYPYTVQMLDYSNPANDTTARVTGAEATNGVDQNQHDKEAALVRTYDVAGIQAGLIARAAIVSFGKVRVTSLPPVLNSITASFNKTSGDGVSNHLVSHMDFLITKSGSGEISPRSTAQGSAAILPVIVYDITNWYADALVNAEFYDFNVASGATIVDILAKIGGGVLDLPVFKKKSHQLKLFGTQISLRQSADSTARLGFDSATPISSQQLSFEYGDESSKEVGASVHVETTPEAIHGAITISSATDSQGVTVTVKANTLALEENGTIVVPAITNEPTALTGTASGSVSPASLSATTPAAIPTTGKYLVDLRSSPGAFGVVNVIATVVNFAQYA